MGYCLWHLNITIIAKSFQMSPLYTAILSAFYLIQNWFILCLLWSTFLAANVQFTGLEQKWSNSERHSFLSSSPYSVCSAGTDSGGHHKSFSILFRSLQCPLDDILYFSCYYLESFILLLHNHNSSKVKFLYSILFRFSLCSNIIVTQWILCR